MGNIDRARQFMPFDALKGLQEALREKEKEVENRKELSEESLLELNEQLQRVGIGDCACIKFYNKQRYIVVEGNITSINIIEKQIEIDNTTVIRFNDIISIKLA